MLAVMTLGAEDWLRMCATLLNLLLAALLLLSALCREKSGHDVGECLVPGLVHVRKDLEFCQLVFGEVDALVHLSHKVEGFGLVGNDEPNHLACFLLFCELTAKCDDVCHDGDPHLVKCFGGVSALSWHDLAPVGLEMVKDTFDDVVGITEVLFIELFDVFFFNAVEDLLDTNVRDRLLKIKLLEEFLCFFLKREDFEGGQSCGDLFVDSIRLSNWCGGGDSALYDCGIIGGVKDKCKGSMETTPRGVLSRLLA